MSIVTLPCPEVTGVLPEPPDHDSAPWHANCQKLSLRRFWEGAEALPNEAGTAVIGAEPRGLAFFVAFEDSDIFSQATADQQKMWTLGDVAELFVKPGTDRSDYWEIHLTPNDFLMDIHVPERRGFIAGDITWEDVIAPSSGTLRRVTISDGGWSVEAVVPWRAFGLDSVPVAGTVWQFAICRYNCNGGLDNPELSSTAQFTQASFHRYEEFANLMF